MIDSGRTDLTRINHKSYLIDHLIEKYGKECEVCEKTKKVDIFYPYGQECLEAEFFESSRDRYRNYLAFFNQESDYLGLVCNQCKPEFKIISPTLEELEITIKEMMEKGHYEKIRKYVKKHPQIEPIVVRMCREDFCESEGTGYGV